MELSMLTIEAFAHYMRGAVTLFFIIWCFKLYVYKRRNRMMKLLYYATLFLSFSFFKDGVFLFASWKNSMLLNDVARTFDLLFIPLICSFFLEAVRPGLVTIRRLAWVLGVQSVFVVVFAVYPDGIVVFCALVMDFIMSLLTIIYVVIFSIKYRNFISSNYSYRENIDVSWVVVSCIVYFSTLFFFTFAFDQTTWLSESMYNLFSIVLWTFLFLYARRHRVMSIIKPRAKAETSLTEELPDAEPGEEEQPQTGREDILTERLTRLMEVNKMYLNPRLSLGDVAQAIGSNKTYLSDYFNNTLHTSFYDYINTFRITEACRIIDAMPEEGRKSMVKVAEMSGFNSKSTFNRYFLKVKGMSPREYYLNGGS